MTESYTGTSYTSTSYDVDVASPEPVSTDLKIRLSGGVANSDFNASLGGARSSVAVVDNTNNNIFDDVTSGEHAVGDVSFRCVYLYNNNATTPLKKVKIYISSESSAVEDEWDIGLGTSGINGVEQIIANESTPPIDVTFTHATTELDGLSPPDIPVGGHVAVWFRRTVSAGTTTVSDVHISIKYVFES